MGVKKIMYVMGNYPKCYNQVNAREYPSVIKDPRVFYVADNKMFRQASIIKTKSYEKDIEEIDKMISELEELNELQKLPFEEQVKRLEESEEDEKDLDSDELLRKRRLEEDEPDSKTQESKYSVLSYHVGSVESGDKFMQKLKGNYKIFEQGDKLMQSIGVNN